MEPEKTVSSEIKFKGKLVTVRVDRVALSGDRESTREIVEHRGAVAVVPVDEVGNVILVRQYRKAVESYLLEIPAGTRNQDEDPLDCVRRELEEETGHTAGQIERLGGFYPSPGFCTEYLDVYLATGLAPGHQAPEEDEDLELITMPLKEAADKVRSGEISDAKSIIGLLIAWDRLGRP